MIRGPAGSNDYRIYVGNLPPDIRTKDVEDVFYKYGIIRDIDLKNRRGGPPFAFVEFEDPRWAAVPHFNSCLHRIIRTDFKGDFKAKEIHVNAHTLELYFRISMYIEMVVIVNLGDNCR